MTMPSLDRARERMAQAAEEQAFWDAHYAELLAKHRDEFVAIQKGEVVAAERDLAKLILVLGQKQIDIRDTWVRFLTPDHSKFVL